MIGISDFKRWLASEEDITINLNTNIQSLERFQIDKELFLNDNVFVGHKLARIAMNLYLKRIEDYIGVYSEGFTFGAYKNLDDFVMQTEQRVVISFLKWFKDTNLNQIELFAKEVGDGAYDARSLYNAMTYYDYLIKETIEGHNYDATLDFMVGFVRDVMSKARDLTLASDGGALSARVGGRALPFDFDGVSKRAIEGYNSLVPEKFFSVKVDSGVYDGSARVQALSFI